MNQIIPQPNIVLWSFSCAWSYFVLYSLVLESASAEDKALFLGLLLLVVSVVYIEIIDMFIDSVGLGTIVHMHFIKRWLLPKCIHHCRLPWRVGGLRINTTRFCCSLPEFSKENWALDTRLPNTRPVAAAVGATLGSRQSQRNPNSKQHLKFIYYSRRWEATMNCSDLPKADERHKLDATVLVRLSF